MHTSSIIHEDHTAACNEIATPTLISITFEHDFSQGLVARLFALSTCCRIARTGCIPIARFAAHPNSTNTENLNFSQLRSSVRW